MVGIFKKKNLKKFGSRVAVFLLLVSFLAAISSRCNTCVYASSLAEPIPIPGYVEGSSSFWDSLFFSLGVVRQPEEQTTTLDDGSIVTVEKPNLFKDLSDEITDTFQYWAWDNFSSHDGTLYTDYTWDDFTSDWSNTIDSYADAVKDGFFYLSDDLSKLISEYVYDNYIAADPTCDNHSLFDLFRENHGLAVNCFYFSSSGFKNFNYFISQYPYCYLTECNGALSSCYFSTAPLSYFCYNGSTYFYNDDTSFSSLCFGFDASKNYYYYSTSPRSIKISDLGVTHYGYCATNSILDLVFTTDVNVICNNAEDFLNISDDVVFDFVYAPDDLAVDVVVPMPNTWEDYYDTVYRTPSRSEEAEDQYAGVIPVPVVAEEDLTDAIEGVITGENTWEDTYDEVFTDTDERVNEKDKTDEKDKESENESESSTITDITLDGADTSWAGKFEFLKTKFPFCIPYDVYCLFSGVSQTAEAPVFHFKFNFSWINYTWEFTVDLSDYEEQIKIFRDGFFILFLVGLAFATSKVIKWV
jgi:hypothetical protein